MFACCSAGGAAFSTGVSSAPGSGVTSFNGRNGAVVSAVNDYSTSQIQNVSGVAGATCTDALNQLDADIAALDTSDIANVSGVAGATCTAALNQLNADIVAVAASVAALDTSDVANVSGVTGATCTAALNQLNADIAAVAASVAALDTSDIANVSGIPGSTCTAALNALGPALKAGAALADASGNVTPTGVSKLVITNNLLTAARSYNMMPAGFTSTQRVRLACGLQSFNASITNGGVAGGTLYTFTGAAPEAIYLRKDSSGNIYVDCSEFTDGTVA